MKWLNVFTQKSCPVCPVFKNGKNENWTAEKSVVVSLSSLSSLPGSKSCNNKPFFFRPSRPLSCRKRRLCQGLTLRAALLSMPVSSRKLDDRHASRPSGRASPTLTKSPLLPAKMLCGRGTEITSGGGSEQKYFHTGKRGNAERLSGNLPELLPTTFTPENAKTISVFFPVCRCGNPQFTDKASGISLAFSYSIVCAATMRASPAVLEGRMGVVSQLPPAKGLDALWTLLVSARRFASRAPAKGKNHETQKC